MTQPAPLILVTRSEPGAGELAALIEKRGFGSLIDPMIRIFPLTAPCPALPENIDAIIVTSGHAVAALSALPALFEKPCFAIGETTAEKLRSIGFCNVIAGEGDGRALAALLIRHKAACGSNLLFPTAAHAALELEMRLSETGRVNLLRWHVYRAEMANRLAGATRDALFQNRISGVTLMSAQTASAFAELIRKDALAPQLASVRAICLSAAIAQHCRALPWRRIVTASKPTMEEILACL